MTICSVTEPDKEFVGINFVGDIMLGDSFHMLGIGVGKAISLHGGAYIFREVMHCLAKADVNVGNLECTFPSVKQDPGKRIRPYVSYSTEYVTCLKEAGFHLVNMANNHTMQYGKDNFIQTEKMLIENNVKIIGSVRNPFQVIKIRSVSFAFLGYSMRPDHFKYNDLQYIEGERKKILDDVALLSKDNDHVIVSLHWGEEFVDYPSKDQIMLAREVIDCGATLIMGHHPHVIQGVEYYKKGIIAYSLGNFVFDKPQKLQRNGILLHASFSKKSVEEATIIPIVINRNYQPEIARGKKKQFVEDLIDRSNKKIMYDTFDQKAYTKDIAKSINKMRKHFFIFFLLNFFRYNPRILLTLISDAIKRRMHRRVYG